jgi:RNA polymerase sigma-70 factor (ECF subfamily)
MLAQLHSRHILVRWLITVISHPARMAGLCIDEHRRILLTSADPVRLWLVAGPKGDRKPVVARELPARAAARTEPTVTPSPFDALEAHVRAVYRYALRLTGQPEAAEDLTQETLLRGWRSRHKLRDSRLARVWLLRIATNLWTDHLRKRKFQPSTLQIDTPCARPSAETVADEKENVNLALAAMDQLPPRQRQVLYLITCEGLSHHEVSQVLAIGMPAVKANLSLARKEMRQRLSDVYNEVCGRRPCRETP